MGNIISENNDPTSEGGKLYTRIVTDPVSYYGEHARKVLATHAKARSAKSSEEEHARKVLATLYFSPEDRIKEVSKNARYLKA